jgi:uncharacterized protein (TIGR02466 family)
MSESFESLVAEKSALPIFPTMVWAHQLKPEAAERINRVFLDQIEAGRQRAPDLQPVGKWQSDQRLHTLPELKDFVDLVVAGARGIMDSENLSYSEIAITGCWANVGFPGSVHRPHSHPNNFLSGVYYVKAPEGGHTIDFHDPRPQAAMIFPASSKLTHFTAQKVTLSVRPGTLFYFPAWLQHSVQPNAAREERISIAFNLMFPDYFERMSPPIWEGNLPISDGD